tara:strand:+ start:586 stop:699 length:114 start_codon:yes stop_codon:yes gene_type:complete
MKKIKIKPLHKNNTVFLEKFKSEEKAKLARTWQITNK